MRFFSRTKGTETSPSRGRNEQPPPPPQPMPVYKPVEPTRPLVVHPPSSLLTAVPQAQPSPEQFQQHFHQTYQILRQEQYPHQQLLFVDHAAVAPGGFTTASFSQQHQQRHALQLQQQQQQQNAAAAFDGGGIQMQLPSGGGAGGGATSTTLLRQAVQAAAREGKPLALNFVAQMQPVMKNNPYGIAMPYQHPYGPQDGDAVAEQLPPEGWQPEINRNPYDGIRIPALPDMRDMPLELQDFRDQCATGVRQAVAMVTAMEHQLWWERSRRQQAEEDCKVLLAAVQMERGLGEALQGAEAKRRAEAMQAAGKLTLAVEELPQASDAATTIQKHIRGHLARKQFESHLRDILCGVDPSLDPAALPSIAQSHISHVNAGKPPRRLGLRSLIGEAGVGFGGSPSPSPFPSGEGEGTFLRRQVDRIGQRLAAYPDAGEPNPGDNSGDPLQANVNQLLSGSHPGSSAQVIAALVRRCRELQAALLEAVGELQQAQLSIEGLKASNVKVTELSEVRSELEAARQDNVRLAAMAAKLRTALGVQHAAGAGSVHAAENPYVAAWYRKSHADRAWQRVPPGGPGGVALMDGSDLAVETWDNLRASVPEPVLVPRVATSPTQYRDLLALRQDMIREAMQGPPDPLFTMDVPDHSSFVYERDTPLVPVPTLSGPSHNSMPLTPYKGFQAAAAPARHSQHQHEAMAVAGTSAYPPPQYQPSLRQQQQHNWEEQERMRQQQMAVIMAAETTAAEEQAGGASRVESFADGAGGGVRSHQYNPNTPVVPVYSILPLIREDEFMRRSVSPQRDGAMITPATPPLPQQQLQLHQTSALPNRQLSTTNMSTNMQYIHDTVKTPPQPPPSEVVAPAAAAKTLQLQQSASGGRPVVAGGIRYI